MQVRLVISFVLGFALIIAACSKKAAKAMQAPELTAVAKTIVNNSESKDTVAVLDTIRVAINKNPSTIGPAEEPAVKEIPTEELIAGPYLLASLTKTPCYGKCPVFEARIYSDGKVEFYGKRNVVLLGYYSGYISQASIKLLLKKAREMDLFNLEQIYPINGKKILDLPNTITYIRDGDFEKNIINNHSSPQALRNFESYFENLINNISYQKSGSPVSE